MDSESENANNSIHEESEDLFGSNFYDDYRSIPELDTYDASDLSSHQPMSLSAIYKLENAVRESSEYEDARKPKKLSENTVTSLFKNFLLKFEKNKYVNQINKMCMENEESIYIEYADLEVYNDLIIKSLLTTSEETLKLLNQGFVLAVKKLFPNYLQIKPELHVRIINLPVLDSLRGLRNLHLNTLIRVTGIVTRMSSVLPQVSIAKFSCGKCNGIFGPFTVDNPEFKPQRCLECQSKGPFFVNSIETIYKDYQKLTIQEIPGTVMAGSMPRSKEVYCFFDLINKAKPGDEVELVGIYKNNFSLTMNRETGFPVFMTVIEANSIINKQTNASSQINEDDIKLIQRLSKRENIKELIINSIAPSIYGYKEVKKAIALSLFSGVRKVFKDHTVRGDINIMLLGDPGTAKSQFLRYITRLSHRAVLTTGQGASSVGLTASIQRDPVTKEWCLEGGALVLADKGVCLIDEFDKMNENDRVSIHEAMEQQTISISKAGIVTSLSTQCAIIAAANPIRGRYNSTLNFNQNVNLSDPIISRFDILCVIKDVIAWKWIQRWQVLFCPTIIQ